MSFITCLLCSRHGSKYVLCIVRVCSAAMTTLQPGGLINNRNVFHTVLEAEKSKRKALVDFVHKWPSLCVLVWWKGRGSSWGLSYRDTNPVHEGAPS